MEKLADGLQKLGEDDLLHVVQLVHDHKTESTYTKNDVESTCLPCSHCLAPRGAVQSSASCMLTQSRRWRISRRPLHTAGQPG